MADGDSIATRKSMEGVLAEAARRGVTKLSLTCSLHGGYAEDDERRRWTAIALQGARGNVVTTGKGHTSDEAVLAALEEVMA